MTRVLPRTLRPGLVWALAGALAIGRLPALAEDGDSGAPPPAAAKANLEDLVRSLGDPDFETRERAFDRLSEAGSSAREALRRRMYEVHSRFRELPGFRFEFKEGVSPKSRRQVVLEQEGERLEVEVDGEGRVRASRTVPGGDRPETWESGNMEAFAKEHPEAWARVKDLLGEGGISLRWDAGALDRLGEFEWPELPRFDRRGFPGRFWFQRADPDRGVGTAPERKGLLGVTVAPLPALLRSHLDVPSDRGLAVESVLEGSVAERLGLREHDILLSLNGGPVGSVGRVRELLSGVGEGETLRVEILRAGRREVREGTR